MCLGSTHTHKAVWPGNLFAGNPTSYFDTAKARPPHFGAAKTEQNFSRIFCPTKIWTRWLKSELLRDTLAKKSLKSPVPMPSMFPIFTRIRLLISFSAQGRPEPPPWPKWPQAPRQTHIWGGASRGEGCGVLVPPGGVEGMVQKKCRQVPR